MIKKRKFDEFLYVERQTFRFNRTRAKVAQKRGALSPPRRGDHSPIKSRAPPREADYRARIPSEEESSKEKLDQIRSLAGYNELIVFLFDNHPSVNNFFNIPIIEENRLNSFQFFEEQNTSIGTYSNLISEAAAQGVDKETLDCGFDLFEAQKFAILQLLTKAEDSHGGNIIIQVNSKNQLIPIPMDFGCCLAHNPKDEYTLPRTTKWEQWPALLYPVDDKIVQFLLNLQISGMMTMIRCKFLRSLQRELSTEEIALFEKKFFHLDANLIMLQEAVKMGLTIKKMIALILPVIDEESFRTITQGVLEGGELWPARERFSKMETAFNRAWDAANVYRFFNREEFQRAISKEILSLSKIADGVIEGLYFSEISYRLRKGLFL